MEYWNDGQKIKIPKPIVPLFQHSNLFALRSLRALRLIFFPSSPEGAETFIVSYATRETRNQEQATGNQELFFCGADSQLLDLAAQRVPVDPQEAGRLELDVFGLIQGGFQEGPFDDV